MKNKKITIILVALALIIGIGSYYFLTHQDKNTSFTIFEKQWLENNKNRVLDISILQDIPVINYNGSGILFDFLNDFEEVTNQEFNRIAYKIGDEIKTDYSFKLVEQKEENDILIYSDNYVLLTKTNKKYNKLSEIENMKLGVLETDQEKISNIMSDNKITFKPFKNITELIQGMNDETEEQIDGIIIPKMSNLNLIISNQNLNISYNINEIKQDYVLHLGSDEKLNDILKKYYTKWKETKYEESFDKSFSNCYFTFGTIDEKDKAKFKSKRYIYGYTENKPYDSQINDELYGINASFLENFSDIADIDIDYKLYNNKQELVNDFNESKIDLFFDNTSGFEFTTENTNLVSNFDEELVVLSLPTNKVTVSSVKALASYNVATIENTKIYNYLTTNGINTKTYKKLEELINNVKEDDVIVLDSETYNYYGLKELAKYKSIYAFNMNDEYSYKVINNEENQIFINYFNFYLSFVSNQEISNIGYSKLTQLTTNSSGKYIIIGGISVTLLGLFTLLFIQNKKNAGEKINMSKDNKIKYIDVLTSLKNRNFLNDNIDTWDESLVYPQGIIIVDLNNIAYINDNYGHAEGDKIIKEAANILIKTQISNTEIMRTNGNEFLIYMVGYDEKQIISYIRKLNKEFKELSHNFGAAIGYSTITDEIKTVDDAINEATIDMRNNKEESRL